MSSSSTLSPATVATRKNKTNNDHLTAVFSGLPSEIAGVMFLVAE